GDQEATSMAEPPQRTLTLTIPADDLWWFHAAEVVFQRLTASRSRALFFECLLAEALDTLPLAGPSPDETERQQRLDRWRAQLAAWRLEAEQLCEAQRMKLHSPAEVYRTIPKGELASWSSERLDAHIVELALRLRQRDHQLGLLAIELQRHEVWLRLGFASAAHYARERLGVSMSLLEKRRALAGRLIRLPELQAAVARGELGHSAALLISR